MTFVFTCGECDAEEELERNGNGTWSCPECGHVPGGLMGDAQR